jgi:class 3 adenylate cyclase
MKGNIGKHNKLVSKKFKHLNVTNNKEETLKIKIGIHYGRALSGVIGYHKP